LESRSRLSEAAYEPTKEACLAPSEAIPSSRWLPRHPHRACPSTPGTCRKCSHLPARTILQSGWRRRSPRGRDRSFGTGKGIYGRAYQIVNIPTANLNCAVREVAFSALSRLQDDPIRFRSYFLKGFSLVLGLTLPINYSLRSFLRTMWFSFFWDHSGEMRP
jgi:Polysaccharide biosynthesis protein